jgi:hypothetical protein
MNQINTVWSLTNKFVDDAKLVTINSERIMDVAADISGWKDDNPFVYQGFPKCIPSGNIRKIFLYELIANSVNYCFWLGKHNIRPNEASSTRMYNLLDESFEYLEELKETATFDSRQEKEIIINTFITKLSTWRFPLIDLRVRHLNEILNRSDLLSVIELSVHREDYSVEKWLEYLITSFPGYSKDMFLKRAFLFIMQMYRRCGIFKKEIGKVLVPADYQIPKMLRWLGCIEYDDSLAYSIDNNYSILEGCVAECEIRAATIVVCRRIADLARCTCEEVDTYLFGRRNWCTCPFHLTITSNY